MESATNPNAVVSPVQRYIGLVVAIGVCLAAGALGGWATSSQIPTWYAELKKPDWNPPAWVFGPVWTTLYLMMGVAAWLVWCRRGWSGGRVPLGLFALQLALNSLWSFLFFAWHLPGWAAVDIALLWLAIAATIAAFWPVSRVAAGLLIPYLAWVTFATALNLAIWQLNR